MSSHDSGVPEKTSCTDSPSRVPSFSLPPLLLECTAFTRSQLIRPEDPQAALAGRSNVGKSSLINALAGRKALAKVSATPGKTRSINYYRLQGHDAFLVDLPGYGYARCGKQEKQKWHALLEYYFCNSPGLRRLVLLLDARLAPQQADKDMLWYAEALGLPVAGVLTKADKCTKRDLGAVLRAWQALLGKEQLTVTSSHTRDGVAELGLLLASLLLEGRS